MTRPHSGSMMMPMQGESPRERYSISGRVFGVVFEKVLDQILSDLALGKDFFDQLGVGVAQTCAV